MKKIQKKTIRTGLRLITVCILGAFFADLLAFHTNAADEPPPVSDAMPEYDGYLIALTEEDIPMLASETVTEALEPVWDNIYWTDDLSDVKPLMRLGVIDRVEPNYYVTLFDIDETGIETNKTEISDSNVSNGWAYDAISAEYGEKYGLNGEGIRIAVIDSGVDLENLDLQNADIAEGYDFVEETSEIRDSIYHGTKVTQLIVGDYNSLGVTGIARNTQIIPLCCFTSTGSGTVKLLVQAIEAAVDTYGCDIINMSWGLQNRSETLYDAIKYAYDAGVIMIAAAGNVTSSYSQGTKMYPASFDEVISVSALNSKLTVLSSSQQNSAVCVCAPGGGISFIDENGTEVTDSGTSFAAPCVAAVAAIIKQLAPFAEPDDMIQLLQERSVDLGEEGYDSSYGYGLPKADAILETPWAKLSVQSNDGQIKADGWLISDNGGRIYAVTYSGYRQMLDLRVQEASEPASTFSCILDAESVEYCSIFYLDNSHVPLATSDTFSVQAADSES